MDCAALDAGLTSRLPICDDAQHINQDFTPVHPCRAGFTFSLRMMTHRALTSVGPSDAVEAAIWLPVPNELFQRRARRFGVLAATQPALEGFLTLMAEIGELQTIAARQALAGPQADSLDWRALLRAWCEEARLSAPWALSEAMRETRSVTDDELDQWADGVMRGTPSPAVLAILPLLAAALQVDLTLRAARADQPAPVSDVAAPVCPTCGGWPVAGVLRHQGDRQGARYLHCAWCATAWLQPRIQCVQCRETRAVAYQSIEGTEAVVRAETCDACGTYLKQVYLGVSPTADPVADDLASMALDLLLAEQGYRRLGSNPLLGLTGEPLRG